MQIFYNLPNGLPPLDTIPGWLLEGVPQWIAMEVAPLAAADPASTFPAFPIKQLTVYDGLPGASLDS